MDDAPNIGQSNTCPFKISGPMQALENSKELVRIAHVKPDSVVTNKNHVLTFRVTIAATRSGLACV
jgi:hypothetical protein